MGNPVTVDEVRLRCQLAVAALARRREETLRQRTPEDQSRAHYMRGTIMWHLYRVRRPCARRCLHQRTLFSFMLERKTVASLC